MWERTKEIYADVYAILTAGWVLFHLVMICIYGTFTIGEKFPWVIYVEICLLTGLVALHIERFIKDLK